MSRADWRAWGYGGSGPALVRVPAYRGPDDWSVRNNCLAALFVPEGRARVDPPTEPDGGGATMRFPRDDPGWFRRAVERVAPRAHVEPTGGGCACLAAGCIDACLVRAPRGPRRCVYCGGPADPMRWPECGSCQRGVVLTRAALGPAWLAEHKRQLRARDAARRAARNGGGDDGG